MLIAMQYDDTGLQLTESCEGLRLTAYWDAMGKVWTIGFGHTGPDVHEGMVITFAQAVVLLKADLARAEVVVNHSVIRGITQGEFDGMVDFAFNAGCGAFLHSTLLQLVNAGNFAGAAAEFAKWVLAGGKRVPGLVLRRQKEEQLFARAA